MQSTQKRLLLEQVASEAYNVGYTARLHFATLDIATKVPGWVTIFSLLVAALSLFIPGFGRQWPTVGLLVVGIGMLYVRYYEERTGEYESIAKFLNEKFKQLQDLSNTIEAIEGSDAAALTKCHEQLKEVREAVKGKSITRQIFLANWRAHYQFFWVVESAWVAKYRQPPFRFWRDKVPLSFSVLAALLLILGVAVAITYISPLIATCWGTA